MNEDTLISYRAYIDARDKLSATLNAEVAAMAREYYRSDARAPDEAMIERIHGVAQTLASQKTGSRVPAWRVGN